MGIVSAAELKRLPNNKPVIAAGAVITRQRPGTAKGLIFLTLEDETGHANVIVMPDVYARGPMVIVHERFLRVEGKVQNHEGVVYVRAEKITPLGPSSAGAVSHDFR
jgi:error-prone DNA polymerase